MDTLFNLFPDITTTCDDTKFIKSYSKTIIMKSNGIDYKCIIKFYSNTTYNLITVDNIGTIYYYPMTNYFLIMKLDNYHILFDIQCQLIALLKKKN